MRCLKFLKKQLKKDLREFRDFFNPYTHFTGFFKSFKIIFLILFFPYIIMIWYAIRLYRYVFIYFFLILDVFFYDLFPNRWIKKIYKLFYKFLYYTIFYPIFGIVPNVYHWFLHKLTLEYWLGVIMSIVNFFGLILHFFLYRLLRFILWVDQIDETYANIRFYWVMRRDLIWGVKYARRLKRKKKAEIRKRKQEERDAIREERILRLKKIRDQVIIKILNLLIFFYDKVWLIIRWYYLYNIYLNILYKIKYFQLLSKKMLWVDYSFYYWKAYQIYNYLAFTCSGWWTIYYYKSVGWFLYIKYLRFRQMFSFYTFFSLSFKVYLIVYNEILYYFPSASRENWIYIAIALISFIILLFICIFKMLFI